MASDEPLSLSAVVEEQLPNGRYRVRLANGHKVLAYVSGRMRMHFLRILPGDRVTVELSPYNLAKGRIVLGG